MRIAVAVFGMLALQTACDADPRDPPSDPTTRPVVAATLPPIASLLHELGGDAVELRTLLPPGAHPDSYEATPAVARSLAGASLLVRVGGAADAWLGPTTARQELVLTDGMALHGERGPGTGNPHVWLDPVLVRDVMLPRMTTALTSVAPDAAAGIRERARLLADSLAALDEEIRSLLAAVQGGRFVAAHPAWVYFADRYGLEQVGAIHDSPGSDVGARDLAHLVEQIRARDVRAVIAEPQLGREGVEALAGELGVVVEVADAIGGPGMEGRDDYFSLMRFNARAFARALGSRP
jgi:zinc transport system substrate-binding protein